MKQKMLIHCSGDVFLYKTGDNTYSVKWLSYVRENLPYDSAKIEYDELRVKQASNES